MRTTLIRATVESLIDVGYARTTGVEICRRAGVTRGALNHHFPVYSDLLIGALAHVYTDLKSNVDPSSLESLVRSGYDNVIKPEFKVLIELWLASQNDPDIGDDLRDAIVDASGVFYPQQVGETNPTTDARNAVFFTLFELSIAIGLSRATSGGKASAHEHLVFETMLALASQHDSAEM